MSPDYTGTARLNQRQMLFWWGHSCAIFRVTCITRLYCTCYPKALILLFTSMDQLPSRLIVPR